MARVWTEVRLMITDYLSGVWIIWMDRCHSLFNHFPVENVQTIVLVLVSGVRETIFIRFDNLSISCKFYISSTFIWLYPLTSQLSSQQKFICLATSKKSANLTCLGNWLQISSNLIKSTWRRSQKYFINVSVYLGKHGISNYYSATL